MSDKPIWTNIGKWKAPEWATYCEARKPAFKVHSSLGLAHSAIAVKKPQHPIYLLHWEDGAWRLEWQYELGEKCERCGNDFTFTMYNHGRTKIVHRHLPYNSTEKVKDAPVICDPCYFSDQAKYRAAMDEARERAELARLQKKFGGAG